MIWVRCLKKLIFTATLLLLLPQIVRADPELVRVDKVKSVFVAVTRRSGLFGFLGHEHAIMATRWFVALRYDKKRVTASSIEVGVPLASLEIDSPEARRAAGLESTGPGPGDIPKIQTEMLRLLKGQMIRFSGEKVEQSAEGAILLKGKLTFNEITREESLPVRTAQGENDTLHFYGVLKFKMSDYGIQPPSKAGVINVKDEIEIRFDVYTQPETVVAGNVLQLQ